MGRLKRRLLLLFLLLGFMGIFLGHFLRHTLSSTNNPGITYGSTTGFPIEPTTSDGIPALLSGDTPTRNQFLQDLESMLDVAHTITQTQVGVLGVVMDIQGTTIVVRKVTPTLSLPSDVQPAHTTTYPLIGDVGGDVRVIVTGQTAYVNASALSAVHTGEVIIAGGTKQGTQLQADMLATLSTTTSTPAKTASNYPRTLSSDRTVSADVPSVQTANFEPTPTDANLVMQGVKDPTHGVERYNVFGEKTDTFGACYATWHLQSMSDFHTGWYWPFNITVPDKEHVAATALARQQTAGAVVMGSTASTLPDNANFTLYTGWGVAEGAGVKLGCTVNGKKREFPIDPISIAFGIVNATYQKAPLSGDTPLGVDDVHQCISNDISFAPSLEEILKKMAQALQGVDTTFTICGKFTVQPATMEARATYDDGSSETLKFNNKPQQLGAGARTSAEVQLSNFSYIPQLQTSFVATFKTETEGEPPLNVSIPSKTLTLPLPSEPNPEHLTLPLQDDNLTIQAGSKSIAFTNVSAKVCQYGPNTDNSKGRGYLVALSASYDGQTYQFDVGGNIPASQQILQVGNYKQNPTAYGYVLQSASPGFVYFELIPHDPTNSTVYLKSINGTITLQHDKFGSSDGYYSALQAHASLEGIAGITANNVTVSGFWHCSSGNYVD